MLRWLYALDKDVLLAINSHFTPVWDNIMYFASGTTSWYPFYALLIIILIIKYKKQSWLMIVMVVPLILISDQLASGIFKPLVGRFRPSHTPGLDYSLHYVKNYQGGLYGFYSSHASNVFALATYLTLVGSRRLKWLPWLLYPWAALPAYSRIYLGVHFPSDVLMGIFMGVMVAVMVAWWYRLLSARLMTKRRSVFT